MAESNAADQEALQFLNSIQVPDQQQAQPQPVSKDDEAMAFLSSLNAPTSKETNMAQEIAAGAARGVAPATAGAAIGAVAGGALGALAGGVGAVPGAIAGAEAGAAIVPVLQTGYDLAITGINKLFGTDYMTASEMANDAMDKLGVPRTSTTAGRISEGIAAGITAVGAGVRAGTALASAEGSSNLVKRVGLFLSENPTQQYAAAMLAPLGSEGAREFAAASGASPEVQELASLAGAFGGALVGGKAGAVKVSKEYNLPKIEGMSQEAILKTIQSVEDAGGTVPTSLAIRPQGRLGQFADNVMEMVNSKARVAASEQASEDIVQMLRNFGADNPENLAPQLAEAFSQSRKAARQELTGKINPILERIDAKGNPVDISNTLDVINKHIKDIESESPIMGRPTIDLLKNLKSDLTEAIQVPRLKSNIDQSNPFKYDPFSNTWTPLEKQIQSIDPRIAKVLEKPNLILERIPIENNPDVSEIIIRGKPISAINKNLKRWGELVPSEQTPLSAIDYVKRNVYGPLKEDITRHILNEEGPSAVKTWLRTNQELSDMAKQVQITAIKKAINTGEINPQLLDSALFSGNEATFSTLHKNLDSEGKRIAQARILQSIAEKALNPQTGELSNTRFLTQLNKNQKLIDTYFKGPDKALIDGTANFLKLTAPAEKLKINSYTGARLFLPGIAGSIGASLGGLGGAAASVGMIAMAKLYDKPMVREALMRLSRISFDDAGGMVFAKRVNQALMATATQRAVDDLDKRKIQVAFNDRAVRKEKIGGGMVLDDSVSGFRIVSKDGKTARLLGPTGEPIGYFASIEDAQNRANKLTINQMRKETKQYAP